MFGYVRIRKDNLKICDFRIYKQKYCGLCQELGKKYGLIYRSILSYDMIFLMLTLENIEAEKHTISFRCPINPLKKIDVSISEQVTEYSAFINYYLAVLKLEDDVTDENSFIKRIMLKLFKHNSNYISIVTAYGDKLAVLSGLMDKVNALEKSNAGFDVLTNSFGEFFVGIFKLFAEENTNEKADLYDNLYSLCFNLGKWIYLMDAYDDYSKDIKNGKFNLLKTMAEGDNSPDKIKTHKKIAVINELLMFKMKEAFFQVKWDRYSEILHNIIFFGCPDTYMNIIHKRYPQIESILQLDNKK